VKYIRHYLNIIIWEMHPLKRSALLVLLSILYTASAVAIDNHIVFKETNGIETLSAGANDEGSVF